MRLLEEDIFQGNKIVLVVGAGVNVSKGAHLQWNQLINPIFQNALRQICEANELQPFEYCDLLGLFDIGQSPQTGNDLSFEERYMDIKNKVVFDYTAPMKMAFAKSVLGKQYLHILQKL